MPSRKRRGAGGGSMAEICDWTAGVAAVPRAGKSPYQFKRPTKHACEDPICPIDGGHLTAFDPNPAKAMLVSRGLWEVWNLSTLLCPFTVYGRIVQLANESFEQGVLEEAPSALANFRALLEEHERPLVQLTSMGVVFSPDGSPGELWIPRGGGTTLQAFAEPDRPIIEDDSWMGGKLESVDDLLADLDDDGDGDNGDDDDGADASGF
jgi:hypothetical protein